MSGTEHPGSGNTAVTKAGRVPLLSSPHGAYILAQPPHSKAQQVGAEIFGEQVNKEPSCLSFGLKQILCSCLRIFAQIMLKKKITAAF